MKRFILLIFICVIFASCNRPFGANGEDILSSEVFDSGIDEEIEVTPSINQDGASATELSYKSWIMVKGQMRDDFEERVETTLTNVFRDYNTAIEVENFDFGECTTSLTHKIRSIREEGFVKVIDSVLVYTVSFDEFSFDYEIDYEVGLYDDEVTKQIMPYHQLGIIKDNGYKLEDLDFIIDDMYGTEYVYIRKLMTHSISVDFCGKKYDMSATMELRKYVGQHPCVVKSELISAAITYEDVNEVIESELVVRRTWSDGKVESTPTVCYLGAYIDCENYDYKVIKDYKNDLEIKSAAFGGLETFPRSVGDDSGFLTAFRNYKDWCIDYGYFNIAIKFIYDEAWYDDKVIRCKMPSPEGFYDIVNAKPIMDSTYASEDENGKYCCYGFKQDVSARYGDLQLEGWGAMEVVAYE